MSRESITLDRLTEVLGGLVRSGTLTPDAATAVVRGARTATRPRDSLVSRITEIGGYLGAALVVAALLGLSGNAWSGWSDGARVTVLLMLAIVLTAGGAAARDTCRPALDRVAGTVWLVAVVALAGGVGQAAYAGGTGDSGTVIAAGVAATGLAAALLRLRTSALQHIACFAAAALTVGGLLAAADTSAAEMAFGFVCFGALWAALASLADDGVAELGLALGGATALVGAQVITFEARGGGLLLGLALAATGYALGLAGRGVVPLALGTLAVAVFGPQVADAIAGDALGGPFVLLCGGLIVLAATTTAVRIGRSGHGGHSGHSGLAG